MYKFNDEPEKCFLGQKVDKTIKKLGAIATMGQIGRASCRERVS